MTIETAINGYSNGKLVLDQLVCQFVNDTGGRVIYRFVIDADHLYLRKDVIFGFGDMTTEDATLTDEDVQEGFPQYIADFLAGGEKVFDVYQRNMHVPAASILSAQFLSGHELEGRDFISNEK